MRITGLLTVVVVLAWTGAVRAQDSVLVVLAQRGFDFREYRSVSGPLLDAGICVRPVAVDTGDAVAMNDSVVNIELKLAQVVPAAYAGTIVIGGVGSVLFWDDSLVLRTVRDFAARPEAVIGGIGLAPIALARSGAFSGRVATVYGDPKAVKLLEQPGLKFRNADVVRDGRLVTARSHESGARFAREFLAALRAGRRS